MATKPKKIVHLETKLENDLAFWNSPHLSHKQNIKAIEPRKLVHFETKLENDLMNKTV